MASRKPAWVAHCETREGFVELDADDADHADRLCNEWVNHGRAISAAKRRVFPDGTLGPVVGRIHSECDDGAAA